MSTNDPDHITEEHARTLLSNVRSFRSEWAQFAVRSRDVFDAFREKGASFPDEFQTAYQSFIRRKAELANSIATSVTGIDQEVWQPPLATDSLHEFEQKLDDLIKVAKELARIISEKREGVLSTLSAATRLHSPDADVARILAGIRGDAEAEIAEVSTKPAKLVERTLEEKVAGLKDLLDLAADASQRQSGQAAGSALSAAECRAKFESVVGRFGMNIAIEALRTGLGVVQFGNSVRPIESPKLAGNSSSAVPTAGTVLGSGTSNVVPVVSEKASHDQILALVDNFQHRTSQPAPAVRKPIVVTSVPEVNPVSLSDLADAANRLKIKAHSLYPNVLESTQLETNPSPIKNRALGLACLSVMLDSLSYIFAERQRTKGFFGKYLQETLQLLAEVQNAVRVDAYEASKPPVPEQELAFTWLKFTCDATHGEAILISRYMRLDDRADPANNPKVAQRVLTLKKYVSKLQEADRHFDQLRQLCLKLAPGSSSLTLGLDLPLWNEVSNSVTKMVKAGVKPSDVKLREALLPIIDELPEAVVDENGGQIEEGIEVSPEFQQVIHAIYDFLTANPAESVHDNRETEAEAVGVVRSMMKGKTLVIVGGVRKPHSAQRLKDKFGLKELRWLEATKSDRVSQFRADLQGAAVVVLITRLIGHKHNDIREMCTEAGIPCVNMPMNAGYSPNIVASEIVRQASNRLAG